jgi:Ca2+-transporting ATPase
MLQGRETLDIFMTAVSLAVAAIPEGLVAVVTIVLAIGVQKMAKRNAIIRKLSAVETLGCTQIICSDKTGTLTQNKMTVKKIYINDGLMDADRANADDEDFRLFAGSIMMCNDSRLDKKEDKTKVIGDPTETALVEYGAKMGFSMEETEKKNPRVAELPFDSDRKLMTTIHWTDNGFISVTKGAPDVLIGRCSHVLAGGAVRPLTDDDTAAIGRANKEMADNALRVLAVAYKYLDSVPEILTPESIEIQLIFTGLVGMIDPPRDEAKEAVELCKQAGIRPIMITGDHKDTAAAIARELGIARDNGEVITGSQLNAMSEEEFQGSVDRYSVYARVSPEHKVRIVRAWKNKGKIVAMTGDGVNDAPALKSADIGVGMGITGTEVSKNVSNMVLADDNFATIVHAVEEGRRIYGNIRKTVQFLLSCNLGEVFTLFIATMLPAVFSEHLLYPIHILWINLVTDTLPALALGMERAEPGVMKKPPRDPKSSFFAEGVGFNVIYQGILEGCLVLLAYIIGKQYSPETATTMAFVSLGLIQLFHSVNTRSADDSVFRIGFFSNPWILGAFAVSAALQLSVIFMPFLNRVFRVVPLTAGQWMVVLGLSFSMIPIVEIVKLIRNSTRKSRHRNA